jgi:hypothetical protein
VGGSVSVPDGPGASAGGSAGIGGPVVTCATADVDHPVFGAQVFSDLTAARLELFSWTTDEQALALRANPELLFGQNQRPGFTIMPLELLTQDSDPALAQVAKLVQASLATGRFAWPDPWAVRVGPEGEDSGAQLLRIVLKPEAWVAVVKGNDIEILDMNNQRVQLADAAAAPERFGAVFHERDAVDGGPACDGMLSDVSASPSNGGFARGYREFIVSNPGMVAEWSLGTQQIKDRLGSNIAQLSEFLARTRSCPDQSSEQTWNQQILCGWEIPIQFPVNEQLAYQHALAIPTTDYYDAPAPLAAMIDKLQGDMFELDPLVVTPGSP